MNDRPCALCRHLDAKVLHTGVAYCWARYVWVQANGTVEDCDKVERADGKPPPGQVHFTGQQP